MTVTEILDDWDGKYRTVEDCIEGVFHDFTYLPGEGPNDHEPDDVDQQIGDWYNRCMLAGMQDDVFPGGEPPVAEFKLGDLVGLMINSRIYPGVVVSKKYDRDLDEYLYILQTYSRKFLLFCSSEFHVALNSTRSFLFQTTSNSVRVMAQKTHASLNQNLSSSTLWTSCVLLWRYERPLPSQSSFFPSARTMTRYSLKTKMALLMSSSDRFSLINSCI